MPNRKLHWMQFVTGDWLKDPAVSLCTPATRGVWMDLLCRMHESGRVGSLSGTQEQLARLARCVPAELVLALNDLQTTGAADVSERNGVVTVCNRRMLRDAKSREAAALRQKKHRSNGTVTPESHLYDSESESDFLISLPECLKEDSILEALKTWLSYKVARGERYEPIGRKSMFSVAAKRVREYGVPAVVAAIERAMANNWQGWDQAGSFKSNGKAAAKAPWIPPKIGPT